MLFSQNLVCKMDGFGAFWNSDAEVKNVTNPGKFQTMV